MPWGEIELEKLRVVRGADSLVAIEERGTDRAMGCRQCWSLVYQTRTAPEGAGPPSTGLSPLTVVTEVQRLVHARRSGSDPG